LYESRWWRRVCGCPVGWKDRTGMAKLNPIQFMQEVRQEVAKVTWPTRKEVWITTVAVLIMVTLSSLFFMLADQIMAWLVGLVLGFGS